MNYEVFIDRALASYLGFACGDALGATVEFLSAKRIKKRYGTHKDIIGGGWLNLAAGQVTDDTQMALALGQAIIDKQTFNEQTVAKYFVNWMETDPPDIGNTCRRSLLRVRDQGVLHGPLREDDAGNGACMRNLPVILATLNNLDNFQDWTIKQCHITHHHPLSDAATLTLGKLVQHLLRGNDSLCQQEARQLTKDYPILNYSPYPGRASAYIVDTVQTVLHYFFNSKDYETCLINTVNQGEDADTTGALAGMLAGAKYGLDAIPKRWLSMLDPNIKAKIIEQTYALLKISQSLQPPSPSSD